MRLPDNAWVFDTGPLRHFSTQGWLGVLRFLADARPVYIPDSVEGELIDAGQNSASVRAVLDADWIEVYRSTDLDYVEAFARYYDRLVVDNKNRGECGVLAMGEIYGC
ncbi:hypothetical protein [Pseudonocardia endophytica]|uniref:hypothetical protein n=1 Tax=Pseudonocardia endophytica TaxID=401976 RepID=UPI001FB46E1E|nr:hypothetical protein [Pseudonocardia endophytica]